MLYSTNYTREPYPGGKYYIVDIHDALEEYLRRPRAVRFHSVRDGSGLTDEDILDVEMASVIPCMERKYLAYECIDGHADDILGDELDFIVNSQPKDQPIDEDKLCNTPECKFYSEIIHTLALEIFERLKEESMYDALGRLRGTYHAVRPDGSLILRVDEEHDT